MTDENAKRAIINMPKNLKENKYDEEKKGDCKEGTNGISERKK